MGLGLVVLVVVSVFMALMLCLLVQVDRAIHQVAMQPMELTTTTCIPQVVAAVVVLPLHLLWLLEVVLVET